MPLRYKIGAAMECIGGVTALTGLFSKNYFLLIVAALLIIPPYFFAKPKDLKK